MSWRNRQIIDSLKENLPNYLEMKGINIAKPFTCLNPSHEDRNPSMSYFKKGKNVHCFSCGETYDIFDIIGLDYGIDNFMEQTKKACQIFNIKFIDAPKEEKYTEKTIDRSLQLKELYDLGEKYPEYLLQRGITKQSCERYNLFKKDDRVYFPVYSGDICSGWCARAIDSNTQPKYKNSSGSLDVWNGDYLKSPSNNRKLYVTEGVIDAICLEQMGFLAAALCGSSNVNKFLDLCKENLKTASSWEIIICGDPDEAGESMNKNLAEQLEALEIRNKTLYLKGSKDIADLYLEDKQNLSKIIHSKEHYINPEAESYNLKSSANLMRAFFDNRENFSQNSKIATGFSNIDNVLDGGLYPAFYVIGSVASLGKTSFVLQLADQLSEQQQDVLFFTLEQSRQELIAKSISRISAKLDAQGQTKAFTASDILSGKEVSCVQQQALLNISKEKYLNSSQNLFVVEGIADIGTSEIEKRVKKHIKLRAKKPIVIIDYLQILKPHDLRMTDKQNIDKSVVDLKRMSRDLSVPVIAVSSFNRENYRFEVSMEAFKESGAVEYSADVLFGLQLKGTGKPGFDINLEKSREPRQIELVMLKNRNGIPYAKIDLDYQAKYSLFWEN